jgi:hypothetical protein
VRENMARGAWALASAMLLASASIAKEDPVYKLDAVVQLKGPAPSWDYLTFDPERAYLFLGRRAAGVTVYDVRARKVVGQVENSTGANAAALVPEFGRGYTTNGDGSTTIFDLATLKAIDRIKLGGGADAAFYDPATKQLAFTMGDVHELTFVDAKTGAVTGRLHMNAEELEGVAPDGKGILYVVERDVGKVAKVDAATHTLLTVWPIEGCDLPTGVAFDSASSRLFLGCKGERPVLTVLDVTNGRVVARMEIGRGNDGVVYDPQTHRVYTSNGVDGNIVIFDQLGPNTYKLSQAITTRPIARTMALDPMTKRIYTMTAEGMVDPAKKINRRAGAFYPNTFFDDTFTLLEYGLHERGPAGEAGDE